MLKGIPPILSPELFKIMMEMGHGDELVFADGNFPAVSHAARLVRCDGLVIPDLLRAVMPFFPLDYRSDRPVVVMSLLPDDPQPEVWDTYRSIIAGHEVGFVELGYEERFAFYARAKSAFAVVATSDMSFKGNLLLKKGVVRNQ